MFKNKRNEELFWIFEALLLTPLALFWFGILSMYLNSSDALFNAVVGDPYNPLRSIAVSGIFPAAAAWIAYKYLSDNKGKNSTTRKFAKYILWVSFLSIVIVLIYLYGGNVPH